MNLTATKENGSASIEIILTGDEISKYIDNEISVKVKNHEAPGFRKGKMPKAMFLKKFGEEAVYSDVIDKVLNDKYPQLVRENELNVIEMPNFDWSKLEVTREGFKAIGTVVLMPIYNIKDYKEVNKDIEKEDVKVNAALVNEEINKLVDNKAMVEVKKGKAKLGDIVVIDFEGFKDGVAFDGGKGENHPLTLGSNSFIPGFEEQLVGTKAEDKVTVEVTFPDNYQAEDLKGQSVVFECLIHEVKQKILPELTDEIVKDIQGYDAQTLADLKKEVKKKLSETLKKEAEQKYNNTIIEKLINENNVIAPQSLINEETENTLNNFKNQIKQQGIEFEMYIQMMGMTEEMLRTDIDKESKRKVEEMLILQSIVEQEKFDISQKEIDNKVKELAKSSNMEVEKVLEVLESTDNLKKDMAFEKAYQLILGE